MNADGTTNPATVNEGTTIKAFIESLTAPTKAADENYTYAFAGWYTDADLNVAVEVASEADVATLAVENTITLYAKYTATAIEPDEPDTPPATVLYGDAYKDGVVDGSDATIILQYLAEMDVDIDLTAADAYYDGVVDGSDATIILQYLAEMDVTMGPADAE